MHPVDRNTMQLADNNRNIKVIKKADQKPTDVYQREHELGLLHLLVQKHPERAKEFLRRLGESMRAAA